MLINVFNLVTGTKVFFELERSRNDFYLMAMANDTEEYQAKITSCFLYVPVGIMSAQMTTDLYNKWNTQNIKYHYQRMVVQGITMPSHKQEFFSIGAYFRGKS